MSNTNTKKDVYSGLYLSQAEIGETKKAFQAISNLFGLMNEESAINFNEVIGSHLSSETKEIDYRTMGVITNNYSEKRFDLSIQCLPSNVLNIINPDLLNSIDKKYEAMTKVKAGSMLEKMDNAFDNYKTFKYVDLSKDNMTLKSYNKAVDYIADGLYRRNQLSSINAILSIETLFKDIPQLRDDVLKTGIKLTIMSNQEKGVKDLSDSLIAIGADIQALKTEFNAAKLAINELQESGNISKKNMAIIEETFDKIEARINEDKRKIANKNIDFGIDR